MNEISDIVIVHVFKQGDNCPNGMNAASFKKPGSSTVTGNKGLLLKYMYV